MYRKVAKRFLSAIATVVLALLLTFLLSELAPGDPLEQSYEPIPTPTSYSGWLRNQKRTALRAQELALDRPAFYFSVLPSSYPDTLFKIIGADKQKALRSLLDRHGNWAEIEKYKNAADTLEESIYKQYSDFENKDRRKILQFLDEAWSWNSVEQLASPVISNPSLEVHFVKIKQLQKNLLSSRSTFTERWIPKVRWNGRNNRFQNWLGGVLKGELGESSSDGRPVLSKIKEALSWSFALNLISITLSLFIGISLGVWASKYEGRWQDRLLQWVLFLLYTIPIFWLAILLMLFFATPEYGVQLFNGIGLNPSLSGKPFWTQFIGSLDRLVLPILCLVLYPSLAFITSQMRQSMVEESGKLYLLAAKARGLSTKKIRWKNQFPNAIFSLITLVGSIVPGLVSGSIILEYIFNIPGIGGLLLDSIQNNDWNVVMAIVLMAAVFTVLGFLLTDLFYWIADPRLRYSKSMAHD